MAVAVDWGVVAVAERATATATATPMRGELLMAGGGLLLGTLGVFAEEAAQSPATTVWFRCVFGLLALLGWAAARGQLSTLLGLQGRALALVAGAGASMILSWGLFFAAIGLCSIAVSTVVVHLQPFWLLAWAALVGGERVRRAQWGAAAVALLGLVLASGLALPEPGAGPALSTGPLWGVALSVAASLAYAAAVLLAHAQAARVGSLALAVGPCAVGSVLLAPWVLLQGLPAPGAAWLWLAGLGVLHTGLAYVLLYAGMARLPAGRVAVLQFVYPATAVLVDAVVYGRSLGGAQGTGVLLIGAALWGLRRAAGAQPGR